MEIVGFHCVCLYVCSESIWTRFSALCVFVSKSEFMGDHSSSLTRAC